MNPFSSPFDLKIRFWQILLKQTTGLKYSKSKMPKQFTGMGQIEIKFTQFEMISRDKIQSFNCLEIHSM